MTAFRRRRRSLCLRENRLVVRRKNGSIGLRNGRMNSKLVVGTRRQWKPGHRPGFRQKTARPRRQYPPESRESSLDPLEESYCSTARLGRLAEAGFGVSGERSLIRLINSACVVHLRGAPACHAAGRGSSPIAPAIPSKQLRVNGLRSCHATKTRIDASLKHLTSILLYGNIAVWR
jgi:hypothetical protein